MSGGQQVRVKVSGVGEEISGRGITRWSSSCLSDQVGRIGEWIFVAVGVENICRVENCAALSRAGGVANRGPQGASVVPTAANGVLPMAPAAAFARLLGQI